MFSLPDPNVTFKQIHLTAWNLAMAGLNTLVRRLLLCVAVAFLANSWRPALAADAETKTVQLIVDYGDGSQKHFTKLEWKEGLTVLAALQQAAKHPRGIKPSVQGSGEFALVISIDELKNEGNGKNWLYRDNGKLADKSCGIQKLNAGDVVTWQFSADMP
jgi:hypothetical protein